MAIALLTNVTSTGTGSTQFVGSHVHVAWAVDFSNAGGSCTALVVDLECSLDEVNWFVADTITFSASELTAEVAGSFASDKLLECVRANVTTLTDTGTTTISVQYEGRSH